MKIRDLPAALIAIVLLAAEDLLIGGDTIIHFAATRRHIVVYGVFAAVGVADCWLAMKVWNRITAKVSRKEL